MAMAARVERAERSALVRSRVHGGVHERAMVKSTASVAHVTPANRRPQLVVVAPVAAGVRVALRVGFGVKLRVGLAVSVEVLLDVGAVV